MSDTTHPQHPRRVSATVSLWLVALMLIIMALLIENRRQTQDIAEARYQGQIMGRLDSLDVRVQRNERSIETLSVFHSLTTMGAVDESLLREQEQQEDEQ